MCLEWRRLLGVFSIGSIASALHSLALVGSSTFGLLCSLVLLGSRLVFGLGGLILVSGHDGSFLTVLFGHDGNETPSDRVKEIESVVFFYTL